MCQLASSVVLWPSLFTWVPDTQKVFFSKWHYAIIFVMPLMTIILLFGNHLMRKLK